MSDVPRKIAAEAYDRVLDGSQGEDFNVAEVVDEIIRELQAQEFGDQIIEDYARKLGEAEDEKRSRQSESYQGNLFTGEPEALDGVMRLGGGRRVQVRYGRRDDILQWLAQRKRNAAAVLLSLARAEEDAARVLPYMTDATVTVEEARRRWQQDNPE